jgi:thiol-disulfide isomerase/thioredoxin
VDRWATLDLAVTHPWRDRLQQLDPWLRTLGYAFIGYAAFQLLSRGDSGPKENTLAPAFALEDVTQRDAPLKLEQWRGQPVVMEVFASWCKACRAMAPTMADLARAPRKREVRFVGVALDTPREEAVALHQSWGIPFSVALADDQFSSDYQIKVLPTIIVIDADGRVRHVTTGATRGATIDGWLEDLGAERVR